MRKRKLFVYQCKRNVCKNAESPSIITNIANVKVAQMEKNTYNLTEPTKVSSVKPICSTMFHNTSDNSEKKKVN